MRNFKNFDEGFPGHRLTTCGYCILSTLTRNKYFGLVCDQPRGKKGRALLAWLPDANVMITTFDRACMHASARRPSARVFLENGPPCQISHVTSKFNATTTRPCGISTCTLLLLTSVLPSHVPSCGYHQPPTRLLILLRGSGPFGHRFFFPLWNHAKQFNFNVSFPNGP